MKEKPTLLESLKELRERKDSIPDYIRGNVEMSCRSTNSQARPVGETKKESIDLWEYAIDKAVYLNACKRAGFEICHFGDPNRPAGWFRLTGRKIKGLYTTISKTAIEQGKSSKEYIDSYFNSIYFKEEKEVVFTDLELAQEKLLFYKDYIRRLEQRLQNV